MACGSRVIWDPVPKGSRFRISARGDEDLFNVFASVSCEGDIKSPLRHDDIVPGPAAVPITGKKSWVIKPTLFLSADTDDPVVLQAEVVDENGNVVKIKDDDGSEFEARCEWKIDDDDKPLRIKISVRSK